MTEIPQIRGWDAIAAAIARAMKTSCCERTARRYAAQGRSNRLRVMKFANGRVYLRPVDLEVFKLAEEGQPTGARSPGRAA